MSGPLSSPPEITPMELARLLEAGELFQLLDVRAPERVARGAIDLIPPDRFVNVPGSRVLTLGDLESVGLNRELPVVAVCGHGLDSRAVAAHLNRLGADASSLAGGLAAWMTLVVPRALDPPEGVDRLIQFDRIGKGCLGYLAISDGQALIVDPPLTYRPYLTAMKDAGAELVGVADTHVHADYVSGAPLLARELSVPYYLHPADAVYPYDGTPGRVEYQPVEDGDAISFGQTALVAAHTPGHTEGSVSFLLEDRLAFTGDFLFVESIGRPDLGGHAAEWAGALWGSVVRAREEWDPGLALYPAHYASATERRMGQAVGISMGQLLEENTVLQLPDEEAFVRFILGQEAPFPEAYKRIKALNLGLAPIVQREVEELEVGRNECALGGV